MTIPTTRRKRSVRTAKPSTKIASSATPTRPGRERRTEGPTRVEEARPRERRTPVSDALPGILQPSALRQLVVRIPGEPVAQGRPRAFTRPGMKGVRMYDPPKSRNWKATAQQFYADALERAGI